MRWLFAGCCGIALINVSVCSVALLVSQNPRFYGVRPNTTVFISCESTAEYPHNVTWYKAPEYTEEGENRRRLETGGRIGIHKKNRMQSILYLTGVETNDTGLYYCRINDIWGPGTELHVFRHMNLDQATHRSNMKDGLIVLQGLLLAVCIAALMLRKQKLLKRRDSVYMEPETDHIYEGLAIETCGVDLYEDISVYTQADGTEIPWE